MKDSASIMQASLAHQNIKASVIGALKHSTAWQREWQLSQRLMAQDPSSGKPSMSGNTKVINDSQNVIPRYTVPTVPETRASTIEGTSVQSQGGSVRVGTPDVATPIVAGLVNLAEPLVGGAIPQSLWQLASMASRSGSGSQFFATWGMRRLLEWRPLVMHTYIGVAGVKVWIRDSRHQLTNGGNVLQSLRQAFARTGLQLAQVVINGETIFSTVSASVANADVLAPSDDNEFYQIY